MVSRRFAAWATRSQRAALFSYAASQLFQLNAFLGIVDDAENIGPLGHFLQAPGVPGLVPVPEYPST
ncbi:MAG: hypothetical protein DMG15_03195 [Acidobacteria bacterium]|nr:MAG: hypothetical protein DMG16_14240 [Acidobacteriota bacterium]PYS16080.1 MAG: hypothetical protein DMG15_03195 [Acidobacteriota bacterium]